MEGYKCIYVHGLFQNILSHDKNVINFKFSFKLFDCNVEVNKIKNSW